MGCIALKPLVPKAEQTEVRLPRLKVATPQINIQQSLSEISYLVDGKKRTASRLPAFEVDPEDRTK